MIFYKAGLAGDWQQKSDLTPIYGVPTAWCYSPTKIDGVCREAEKNRGIVQFDLEPGKNPRRDDGSLAWKEPNAVLTDQQMMAEVSWIAEQTRKRWRHLIFIGWLYGKLWRETGEIGPWIDNLRQAEGPSGRPDNPITESLHGLSTYLWTFIADRLDRTLEIRIEQIRQLRLRYRGQLIVAVSPFYRMESRSGPFEWRMIPVEDLRRIIRPLCEEPKDVSGVVWFTGAAPPEAMVPYSDDLPMVQITKEFADA